MFHRMRALLARLAGSSHPVGQDQVADGASSLARPVNDAVQPSRLAAAGPALAADAHAIDEAAVIAPAAPVAAPLPSVEEELAHAQRLLATGKVNRAISALEARLRVAPDAEVAASLSDLETIQRAGKRLQRHPRDPRAHFDLGRALFSQEQGPRALDHLAIVCHLRPSWLEAHLLRAYELHWEGRWREAESAYQAVLQLDPAHIIARRGLLAVRVCQPPDALMLPHDLDPAAGHGSWAAGGG